jgi:hypothetical protein
VAAERIELVRQGLVMRENRCELWKCVGEVARQGSEEFYRLIAAVIK